MSKSLFSLDQSKPQVMAVLNVTPDSFSDGGQFFEGEKLIPELVRQSAEKAIIDGATILDVGGESTRPGAKPVSTLQELDRVIPVMEALQGIDAVISVDTSTPEVMSEAAKFGMGLVNDVRALQRPGALDVAASLELPICLMHMQGEPGTMQSNPRYDDVVEDVLGFLLERVEVCKSAGISESHILIDPGFGFGKTVEQNKKLLRNLALFQKSGYPLLVGISRKSMIQHILGERTTDERLPASLALAVMAVERGAWIIRAHDIKATYDALMIADAIIRE